MILSSAFSWNSLIPIVILLSFAVIIPIILAGFKLKFIPVLVIEIICGIILGNIPFFKEFFVEEGTNHFNGFVEGVYTIGLAILLFISGLEVDFSVLKVEKKNNTDTLPALKISLRLILLVILVSFGLSFLFINNFVSDDLETRIIGIVLLTIIFSSSFASIIIPLIHDDHMQKTTIGKFISTYSTLAEFISIVGLSALMIIREIIDDSKPWLLIIFVVILIIVALIRKFIPVNNFKRMLGGIVHLDVTLSFFVLIVLAFLTQMAGAEFILGTFLAGVLIKSTGIKAEREEKLNSIGYGLFIPMFYILVGFKVGLMCPIEHFFEAEHILLILKVFLALIIAKIPFMFLSKWFKFSTTITSMLLVTTTIIVGIACEHFGIFTEDLTCSIIIASTITCVIPPISLFLNKNFGYSKEEYNDVVINPDEVNSEE